MATALKSAVNLSAETAALVPPVVTGIDMDRLYSTAWSAPLAHSADGSEWLWRTIRGSFFVTTMEGGRWCLDACSYYQGLELYDDLEVKLAARACATILRDPA